MKQEFTDITLGHIFRDILEWLLYANTGIPHWAVIPPFVFLLFMYWWDKPKPRYKTPSDFHK